MADAQQPPSFVHLPALISDEFGVSQQIARHQIMLGMVEIDGEKYEGDAMDLPVSLVDGKRITVIGRDRHFDFTFDASKRGEYR